MVLVTLYLSEPMHSLCCVCSADRDGGSYRSRAQAWLQVREGAEQESGGREGVAVVRKEIRLYFHLQYY